jgi:site-specific DNA-methyltransferase (adenine-specific)
VLAPGGALFVYHLPAWAFRLAEHLDRRLTFRHWIALTMKSTYPRGRKLYPAHYALLYFTKGAPRTFNRVRVAIPKCRRCGSDVRDYGGHRRFLNPEGLSLTDFWDDTSPNRHRRTKFRTFNELKPLIPGRALDIATAPGDLVLDPFAGGGSTLEAAEERGRHWLGIEKGSCEPARDRLRERFGLWAQAAPPERLRRLLLLL